ncbi:MAG: hypothetical protein DHS20C14_10500 [Phycisphaeraceae bacterium]|nr:MAG: hypothetical protein DHS20C14_10500 [Phycisphaeraceae bacterium]
MATNRQTRSPAFTLIEVLVIVVVIGILASVAVPVVSGAQTDARTSSANNTAYGVRAAIASFRHRAVIEGTDPFPTAVELATVGTVLDREIGENPWTGLSTIRSASLAEAQARTVVSEDTFGWAYHVNNASDPPIAIFYANCTNPTTRTNPATGTKFSANEL